MQHWHCPSGLAAHITWDMVCLRCKQPGHTTATCPHRIAPEHGCVQAASAAEQSMLGSVIKRERDGRCVSDILKVAATQSCLRMIGMEPEFQPFHTAEADAKAGGLPAAGDEKLPYPSSTGRWRRPC